MLNEVNSNPEYASINRLIKILGMKPITVTKKSTAINLSKKARDATSRFLNRLMILPLHVQTRLFELIEKNLKETNEFASGYKSLRGNRKH